MNHNSPYALQDFITKQHDEQLGFLASLVKIPSDNPPGDCAAHAQHTAQALTALGFSVEQHPVPQDQLRATGMTSVINLVVRERFGPGPTIALNAHGDVVPPGEGWSTDPYGAEIHDGMMVGRGVAVSKSDFATYAYALLALKSLEFPLHGAVELHLTYDEEVGGRCGPPWLLENGISQPDYVLSAGFAYGIITHHNGCLHLEVIVEGRSAHAAVPDTGIDALEAANGILNALYHHRASLQDLHSQVSGIDSPSLVVGLIQGGINTNVVPDRVSLRLDRRMIPEEDPIQVEQDLRELINSAIADYSGIRCQIKQLMLAHPLKPVVGSEDLIEPLCRHGAAIMGSPVEPHGVPIYTDARHYALAGIPTVAYGAGPRSVLEANGHRADECLVLDDLKKATTVVALTLYDLLSKQP